MCEAFNVFSYEHDCTQALTTLTTTETLQYTHYFSIVTPDRDIIRDLVILSDTPIFFNQYVIVFGFYEDKKRMSRWYITPGPSSLSKNLYEPVYYGDTLCFHDSSAKKNTWVYPRDIVADGTTEWQLCWNDGSLPPKIESVHLQAKELEEDEETITKIIYRHKPEWVVVGSVMIGIVVLMGGIIGVLSYKLWKKT